MSTSTRVAVVLAEDPMREETGAVAGFLAGDGQSRTPGRSGGGNPANSRVPVTAEAPDEARRLLGIKAEANGLGTGPQERSPGFDELGEGLGLAFWTTPCRNSGITQHRQVMLVPQEVGEGMGGVLGPAYDLRPQVVEEAQLVAEVLRPFTPLVEALGAGFFVRSGHRLPTPAINALQTGTEHVPLDHPDRPGLRPHHYRCEALAHVRKDAFLEDLALQVVVALDEFHPVARQWHRPRPHHLIVHVDQDRRIAHC